MIRRVFLLVALSVVAGGVVFPSPVQAQATDQRVRFTLGGGVGNAAQRDPAESPLVYSGLEKAWSLGVFTPGLRREWYVMAQGDAAGMDSPLTQSVGVPRVNRASASLTAGMLSIAKGRRDSRGVAVLAGAELMGGGRDLTHQHADPNRVSESFSRWMIALSPAARVEYARPSVIYDARIVVPILALVSWPYESNRGHDFDVRHARLASVNRLRAVDASLGIAGVRRRAVSADLRYVMSFLSWTGDDDIGSRRFASSGVRLSLSVPLKRK